MHSGLEIQPRQTNDVLGGEVATRSEERHLGPRAEPEELLTFKQCVKMTRRSRVPEITEEN